MADNSNRDVYGGASSNNSNYGSDGGRRIVNDKQNDEESPLLPRGANNEDGGNGTPISTWVGAADYEGLHWTKKPSISWLLPAFFLFALAFGGIIVPRIEFILSLVCRDYLADRQLHDPTFSYIPTTGLDDNPQCGIPEVQAKVAKFNMYMSLISGFLSAITCPKIGMLSDRYGRTKILAMITCGGLANEAITILAAKFPGTVDYRWLLLGAAFDGLCGSFISGMALTRAYATDCVPPPRRAVAFGYFHACLFTGMALGPLISAFVYKLTGDLLTIFYIAVAAHTTFILYILIVVPESLIKKRQKLARERYVQERGDILTTTELLKSELNLFTPLKLLYPTGPGTSPDLRWNLVLLSAIDTVTFGVAMGAGAVVIIYSKAQFHWTSFNTNLFASMASTVRVLALVVLLPILNYIFRTRVRRIARRASGIYIPQKNSGSDGLDLWTVRSALMFEVFGFAFYAMARKGEVFALAGALLALGGIGSPALQSSLTKHVPQDRVGQLLGATGFLHSLARIAFPVITSLIYANTQKTFPQAVFVVLSAMFGIAFLMACLIKPHVYLDEEEVKTPLSPSESRPPINTRDSALTDEEIIGV